MCPHRNLIKESQILFVVTDINECQLASYSCPGRAQCVNVPGSYTCKCPLGFVNNNKNTVKVTYQCSLKCYCQFGLKIKTTVFFFCSFYRTICDC